MSFCKSESATALCSRIFAHHLDSCRRVFKDGGVENRVKQMYLMSHSAFQRPIRISLSLYRSFPCSRIPISFSVPYMIRDALHNPHTSSNPHPQFQQEWTSSHITSLTLRLPQQPLRATTLLRHKAFACCDRSDTHLDKNLCYDQSGGGMLSRGSCTGR